MTPLAPESAWTTTRLITDEWAAEHGVDLNPRMTRAELGEAAHLLSEVSQLVGPVPAEIMAGLVSTLHRRDGASMLWLRLLRSLDAQAKS